MNTNSMNRHILVNSAELLGGSGTRGGAERDRRIADEILSADCSGERAETDTDKCERDRGGEVFSANIGRLALRSSDLRASVWTGTYMQMTTMSMPRGAETGAEVHADTDQFIRVEQGYAIAAVGLGEDALDTTYRLRAGDGIFIPACTWHNVTNVGRGTLKLTSIYAPPQHERCTVEN